MHRARKKKLSVIADECSIDVTKMDKFNSNVTEAFLTVLRDNIETRYVKIVIKYQLLGNHICMLSFILAIIIFLCRFTDTDVMDNLSLLNTSMLGEVPQTYDVSEIMELSSH